VQQRALEKEALFQGVVDGTATRAVLVDSDWATWTYTPLPPGEARVEAGDGRVEARIADVVAAAEATPGVRVARAQQLRTILGEDKQMKLNRRGRATVLEREIERLSSAAAGEGDARRLHNLRKRSALVPVTRAAAAAAVAEDSGAESGADLLESDDDFEAAAPRGRKRRAEGELDAPPPLPGLARAGSVPPRRASGGAPGLGRIGGGMDLDRVAAMRADLQRRVSAAANEAAAAPPALVLPDAAPPRNFVMPGALGRPPMRLGMHTATPPARAAPPAAPLEPPLARAAIPQAEGVPLVSAAAVPAEVHAPPMASAPAIQVEAPAPPPAPGLPRPRAPLSRILLRPRAPVEPPPELPPATPPVSAAAAALAAAAVVPVPAESPESEAGGQAAAENMIDLCDSD